MKDASWSIAWICSFINFLLHGVARLSSLLYLASISRYNVDRSQASLPFVLCYTVRNISGPLIGFIGRKFEIRRVIVSGCILSALGVGTCFFAEDIITVTILWSGVYGLGFGLGTILIPEVLKQHFDKYISNATGIALGGECVAGFVLPALVEFMLDTYGTSGSFLILSGFILHSVPAALLLKSPDRTLDTNSTAGESVKDNSIKGDFSSASALGSNESDHAEDYFNAPENEESLGATIHCECRQISYLDVNSRLDTAVNEDNVESTSLLSHSIEDKLDESLIVDSRNAIPACQKQHRENSRHSSASKIDEVYQTNQPKNSVFLVLRVFIDPPFILILLTQSSMIFIGTMIITIIVDFSRDAGASSNEEVYVLMCLSIADMLGRFGLGWVTDGGYLTHVTFSAISYACMGALMVALVFLKGFAMVMLVAFLFGLFLGGLLIVCPGIIFDHIESDNVTMALASRFVLYAPMSLTQSSLIGFFRGKSGSYNGIFYILGINCLLCSAFSLLTPCAARFRENRKKKVLERCQEKSLLKI